VSSTVSLRGLATKSDLGRGDEERREEIKIILAFELWLLLYLGDVVSLVGLFREGWMTISSVCTFNHAHIRTGVDFAMYLRSRTKTNLLAVYKL
jgi:hypothetical protein